MPFAILPGDTVEATGLVNATELNGTRGAVVAAANENGRVGVRFEGGQGTTKLLKPQNLLFVKEKDPDSRDAKALAVVQEMGVLNAAERARAIRAEVRARWSREKAATVGALWSTLSVAKREEAVLTAGRALFKVAREVETEDELQLAQLGAQNTMEQIGLLTSRLCEEAGHGSEAFAADLISAVARGTENGLALGLVDKKGGHGGGEGEDWDLGTIAEAAADGAEETTELAEGSSVTAAAAAATTNHTTWLWEGEAHEWSELKRDALLSSTLRSLKSSFSRLEEQGKKGALQVLEGTPRRARRRIELRFYFALRSFYVALFARELLVVVEDILEE